MEPCPSPERLRQLLADHLDDSDRIAVARHVDSCRACQERLDQLTALALPFPRSTSASDPAADFLLRLKRQGPASTQSERSSRDAPPGPRSLPTLPGYEILGELGRGGMGVVYKARQLGLNRLVALKMVLCGPHATEESLARFRTEAAAVARLQHANIVQVFEIGEHDELSYFAMEYVAGGTLGQRLDGTPQPPGPAAALVETLARASHVAHEHGIIHRDLKPANVLLSFSDASQKRSSPERFCEASLNDCVPKITDFGLAKLLDGEADLTCTGHVLGTPSYLAPEQAVADAPSAGSGRGVGPATDVYALGAILYEMLTGRPPFKAETPMETVLQVVHQEPVPPSRLQPKVPRDLATICLKCLEKEPRKRYASALALAEDLRRFRAGEPILARRVTVMGRLWRWSQRQPWLAGLTAALLLSLIGGLAGMTALWRRSEGHRQAAEANARTADQRRVEVEAAHEQAGANLYFSRLTQAQLAWRLNDVAELGQLLDRCKPEAGEADLRGWEWHYFKSLGSGSLVAFSTGHAHVQSLAFSPDGQRLLVGGGDPYGTVNRTGDVQVWDLAPCRHDGMEPVCVRTLGKGGDMIFSLVQGADGRLLATGSAKGTVQLWDTRSLQQTRTLRGPGAKVNSLALSPNGSLLAAIYHGGQVKVWDIRTGVALFSLRGAWARFDPDGKSLITAAYPPDQTRNLERWDARDGQSLGTVAAAASCWEFSPDSRAIVAWSGREARVVDWASGRVVCSLAGHSSDVRQAIFSPDGLHVATASSDQTVRLWDARTGAEELLLRGHTGRVGCLAFHPSGRYLASGGLQPGEVRVWDLTRQPDLVTVGGVTRFPGRRTTGVSLRPAIALGFTADSRRVVLAYRDHAVEVRNAAGGPRATPPRWVALVGQMPVPSAVAAISADGRRLASVHQSGPHLVGVWDVATGKEMLILRGHTVPVYHVAWSRDGRRLVTAGIERNANRCRREVKAWDAATGACLAEFRPAGHPDTVSFPRRGLAALSPKGERVAFDDYSAGPDQSVEVRVKVCAVDGGCERHVLTGYEDALTALTFSPDGRHLAAGMLDSGVVVHDLAEVPVPRARAFRGPIHALGDLAFSPDCRLLAAADRQQVRVWHVRWGQEVLHLHGMPPRTTDNAFNPRVAWSPDGRYLAALNYDFSVSVWDSAEPRAPAERFRLAEGRAFAWHLIHAQAAVGRAEERSAAEFHLRALKELEPPNEELGLERAVLYAWLGRWQEALADYEAMHARHPLEVPARAYGLALLRLQAGDKVGWRQACAHLRGLFDRTADPMFAEYLLRACQLAPEAPETAEQLVALAKRAPHTLEEPLLLAAAAYRSGQFARAIQGCKVAARTEARTERLAQVWLFLAMAHTRLGHPKQARQWLAQVEKWRASQTARLGDGSRIVIPPSVEWRHWVEMQILHREANALVQAAKAARSSR